MSYRLIALDLDGTLFDRHSNISGRNIAAIESAQRQGVTVVPCTGRSWTEAWHRLQTFPNPSLGVFVNGAAVNRIHDGHELFARHLDVQLTRRVITTMADWPEAILVFRHDGQQYEYLVTGRGELSESSRQWFMLNEIAWRQKPHFDDHDLTCVLRVGLVAPAARTAPIQARLEELFPDQIHIQAYEAIVRPDPDESLLVMEIFPPEVHKWNGLLWVAEHLNIAPNEIAVLGDGINDLAMFQFAACRIAMANSAEPIKALAHHITHHHDDHGVAHAIEQLLTGQWGNPGDD